MMPHGNTGDGIKIAEDVGAQFDDRVAATIALAPVAQVDAGEGALGCFPVFAGRGLPGVIAVTRHGLRFGNEAASYHEFGLNMLEASAGEEEASAFLVCDRHALRRYGLGPVRPWPSRLNSHLKSGLLHSGRTLEELADGAGIDSSRLRRTVEDFNRHAKDGTDPVFHRGASAYDQANGDAARGHACLGPLSKGPFYAIKVFAGCVGTFAGLKTDGRARVLNETGHPIPGLYAAGNDLSSITGGDYIGGGCTLGPAMTFAYIAAADAVQASVDESAD
jgi:succinate dehydrogenase/fumarate reductase flavoprotein subunit